MKNRSYRNRRGLAPLELVLAIPILLFVLALSVTFGAVACWKVRGEVVARDAIFGRRWPREGPLDPVAPEWRVANATRSTTNGAQLTELENPVFQNPLIRGPKVQGPNGIVFVNNEMLDPQNHQRVGGSYLTRDPAALPKMGAYTLNVRQPLLDGKWQFWQLGYDWNGERRLRRLWDVLNIPGTEGLKLEYQNRQNATLAIYNRSEFFVLDRDDELIEFYGFPASNFHPQVGWFSSLDPDFVQRRHVTPLVVEIEHLLPKTMATTFLNMYEAKLAALPQPPQPLSPAQQAEKTEYEEKIKILLKFLSTLK